MHVYENKDDFDSLAKEFVVRYVEKTALLLDHQKLASFQINDVSEDMRELLFNICFLGLASFEEKSGFEIDGGTFTPRPAFETRADAGTGKLLLGNLHMHQLVDSSIDVALRRLRAA